MSEEKKINVVITKLSELGQKGASYEAFLSDYHEKVIKTIESVSGKKAELVRNVNETYFLIDGVKISYIGVSEWMTNWVAKGELLEQQLARVSAAVGAVAIFEAEKSTIELRKQGELLLLIDLKTKDMVIKPKGSLIYPYFDRIGKLIAQH